VGFGLVCFCHSRFLLCPLEAIHKTSSEGPTDVSGAEPERDSLGPQLPSAKILGRQLPTTVSNFAKFSCDAVDLGVDLEQQPEMFDFLLQHPDLDPMTIASMQLGDDPDVMMIKCDISVASNEHISGMD